MVICRHEAEAEKDRKNHEPIVTALDAQSKKGDKTKHQSCRRLKHTALAKLMPGRLLDIAKLRSDFGWPIPKNSRPIA